MPGLREPTEVSRWDHRVLQCSDKKTHSRVMVHAPLFGLIITSSERASLKGSVRGVDEHRLSHKNDQIEVVK